MSSGRAGTPDGREVGVVVDRPTEQTALLGRPQHRGVDETGRDRVHSDPLRAELERQ